MHDAPRCDADSGVCKMDMRVDKGKTRLLYLPGWVRTRVENAESATARTPWPPAPRGLPWPRPNLTLLIGYPIGYHLRCMW